MLVALSSHRWSGWLLFGAGELLLGLSMGAQNANEMGYRQSVTPDALQGRMNTTMRTINRAMIVVGRTRPLRMDTGTLLTSSGGPAGEGR